MKQFYDEAIISVSAGNGGSGCLSFRREKYIPRGGPDGGDGGDGGSIFLQGDEGLNTLVDFRYQRTYKSGTGGSGEGRQRSGKAGDDLYIRVPIGTRVYNLETEELIGDIVKADQMLCVAQGGRRGLGNVNFKSSTNRAPRKVTPGQPGDQRKLKLELQMLADVGLLGLPNAGKSTLIRAVSAARPKVADYPFTTLHPFLGVVSVEAHRSFVMADIPGLIEGAADGAGLGISFLKHLSRTRLLLHVIDVAPLDDARDPVEDAHGIIRELEKYSADLIERERWLVLNKIDLLPLEEREAYCAEIVERLGWTGPIYTVSAISGEGCRPISLDAMRYLEALDNDDADE